MSDLNSIKATMADLFAQVAAGTLTMDEAAAAATATVAKTAPSKPREFSLSISPKTGKGLINGLREAGRPVELSESEFNGLQAKWSEISEFFTKNAGKFVPDPNAKDKASSKDTATTPAAPAA